MVDDEWIVDDRAPKEDDGHYNVNNVLQPDQIQPITEATTSRKTRAHRVLSTSSAPPGTNADDASTEAPTVSAGGEGAPLLTKEQSEANLARWIPHVIPRGDRPVTRRLTQSNGASSQPAPNMAETAETDKAVPGAFPDESEKVVTAPALPATGHSDLQSSVTTSKEDYDNAAGGEGTAGGVVSALPIPAEGHRDLDSSATTSKEDYDKVGGVDTDNQEVSVNPIPATGHSDIQSSVTTSKEDYEKAGALGTAGLIAGAGTGAALAGAFSAPKLTDENIIPESSLPMNARQIDTTDTGPAINSSGPGTTTADLASQVPLEPKRDAQVVDPVEAPDPSKDASGTPFISSSGPGTTTADLASQVPLEQKRQGQVFDAEDLSAAVPGAPSRISRASGASAEAVAEKDAVDKELLSKVPESEAQGAPASAAKAQTSYYGLATAVPETVEQSMTQAHASPEAATESSAVAEKSAMERELQERVPVVESAGEPAPTISAATATTAPEATSDTAASTAAAITDGKTANEAVPDTDTSTATRGVSAGEIAGGAVAGGAAAAGAAALAARHEDRDSEPPRVDTSVKPDVTTEAAPQSAVPGASPTAAAQVSDGTAAESPGTEHAPRVAPPVETSDADATDYAPPRSANARPGVSTSAAAALSDGTEDPTLSEDSPVAKSPVAGIGAASPHPGFSPVAAAALSDGTEDPTVADEPTAPKVEAPAETSEATATEYAPPQVQGVAPGVSASAAAALSDGTEDPTLDEDAKGKGVDAADQAIAKPENTVHEKVTQDAAKDTTKTTDAAKSTSSTAAATSSDRPESVSRSKSIIQKLSGSAPSTPKKGTTDASSAARSAAAGSPASASTTPKSTTASEGDKKKKKRNRLSQIMHKIFD